MLYMCFVDLEKAFDRVPRKTLEMTMRKKGMPEILGRSIMSLYERAKTRVRRILSCQKSLRLKWGCTKGLRQHLSFCSSGRCCHRISLRGCAK